VSHIQDIRPSTVYSSDAVMQICASFSIGGLGLSVETYQALPLALVLQCASNVLALFIMEFSTL